MAGVVATVLTISLGAYADTKYVSLSGNDGWSGEQETPWRSITHAAAQAQAGDTIYIEGGNYGDEHVVISNTGTAGTPIVFSGYVNASNEWPLIDGADLTGVGICIASNNYIEINRIQATRYAYGMSLSYASHIVLDSLDIFNLGATGWSGIGIELVYCDYCTIRNCVITDAGAVNVWLRYSHYNLMENCTSLCGTETNNPTDYNIIMGYGHGNVFSNCLAQNLQPATTCSGHGIGIKDTADSYGRYTAPHSYSNTFIDCTYYGHGMEGFYASHYAYNNTFINCAANLDYADDTWSGGLVVRDGACSNLFANCRVTGYFTEAISLQDTVETRAGVLTTNIPATYTNTMTVQRDNIFSNCIIEGAYAAILLNSTDHSVFKNCVLARNDFLFATMNSNKNNRVANSIVTDTYFYEMDWHASGEVPDTNRADDVYITYSDFWYNDFFTPSGNMEDDPLFADEYNGDYHLKSQFGRWNGSNWVYDSETSPCIDYGDPTDEYANEPHPNGDLIDIGVYGNTAQASKSAILGEWHCNEASGATNVPDCSGYTNNGVLSAGMNPTDCWVAGTMGNALQFDGTDDYVNCGNKGSLNITNGELTISVWVKPTTLPATTSILGKWQSGAGGYSLATVGANVLLFVNDATHFMYAYNAIATGTWTHVVYTIDNTVAGTTILKNYINGVYYYTRTYTNFNVGTTANNFYIGAYGKYGTLFNGAIDEPMIYGRVMSSNGVSQQYLDGITRGKWRFDELSGATNAVDISGYTNNGVLSAGMDTSNCWVAGKTGNALQFDGTDDYVNCGNNTCLNMTNGELTIAAWLKPAALPATTSVLGKWQLGTGGYSLTTVGDDVLLFIHDQNHFCYAYNVLATGTWTHVVYTIDNTVSGTTAIRSYINGAHKSARIYTNGLDVGTTGNDFYIGAYGRYGTLFQGVIDEPRIYSRMLRFNEIYELWQEGL